MHAHVFPTHAQTSKSLLLRLSFLTVLVLAFTAALFTTAYSAYADEGEPTFSAYVRTPAGSSTPDKATTAQVYRYSEGGWWTYNFNVYINYENLPPSTSYGYRLTRGNEVYTNRNSLTTSDTGSGQFRIYDDMAFFSRLPGFYNAIVEIIDNDTEETLYTVEAPEGDLSMSFYLQGVASNRVYPQGDENNMRDYITTDEVAAETPLEHLIQVEGLTPNTEYTVTSYLARIDAQGGVGYAQRVGDTITTTFTTDETGTAEHRYTMGVYPQLQEGGLYTPQFTLTATNNPRDTYRYTFRYAYMFLLEESETFTVIKAPEQEEPAPPEVNVAIAKRDIDTNEILPGAGLKLIAGTDPAATGDAVLDTWTSTTEPHAVTLVPGEYVLVEESAPNNYDTTDPVHFKLIDDDANARHYNFTAYTKALESEDGIYFDAFHLQKDGSDQAGEIAYCINYGKSNPGPVDFENMTRLFYKEIDVMDEELATHISNMRVDPAELPDILKSIVYAGFPNDAAGLKSTYGLTDATFEQVTQDAIHYYTDSMDRGPDRYGNDMNAYAAFQELIAANVPAPEDMTVKIYIPTNSNYQAVVSTFMRKANITVEVDIKNKKKEEETSSSSSSETSSSSSSETTSSSSSSEDETGSWSDSSDDGNRNSGTSEDTSSSQDSSAGSSSGTASGGNSTDTVDGKTPAPKTAKSKGKPSKVAKTADEMPVGAIALVALASMVLVVRTRRLN